MNRKDIATIEDHLTNLDEDNLVESSEILEPTATRNYPTWKVCLSSGAVLKFVVDDREGSLSEEDLALKAQAILEIGR